MAAVRCWVAVQLWLLLVARASSADQAQQPAPFLVEKTYDNDLVFEDESSLSVATLVDTKPLLLDDADRVTGRPVATLLADSESSERDTEEAWYTDLSTEDGAEELDADEEENQEDESANEVGLPPSDATQGDDQSWLMRSVKRIKRSIDNLWSAPPDRDTDPKAPKMATSAGERNGTKQAKRKKASEAKEREKKMEKHRKRVEKASKPSASSSGAPVEKQDRPHGKPRKLVAAHNLAAPAFTGKSGRFAGVRSKRQFDEGPVDDEGSGFEGSGENGLTDDSWATYKIMLTVPEPFEASLRDPARNSDRLARISGEVKRLVDNALVTDSLATAKQMDPYPSDKKLTLVTLELSAPKDFNLDDMEEKIRAQLQSGGRYSLRPEGLSLTLADDADTPREVATDEVILDPVTEDSPSGSDDNAYGEEDEDEDEEDEEEEVVENRLVHERTEDDGADETTTAPAIKDDGPLLDKCRGDDKVRCGQTPVFICAVQKCDGHVDCPNGEDEDPDRCPKVPSDCTKEEFFCDNRCIARAKLCDGHRDCAEGQDERDCAKEEDEEEEEEEEEETVHECRPNEFTCEDGACIPFAKRCDRQIDCRYGDDENDCHTEGGRCDETTEFMCNDGSCIPRSALCDRHSDCAHGEDEDCDHEACPRSTWQCDYGQCIPQEQKCDGNIDCPDDISDERNCPTSRSCTAYEFQCRSDRRCIPAEKHCNRVYDCADGSDEKVCDCRPHEFRCQNGHCIPMEHHCDRWNHCSDGSDEMGCDPPSSEVCHANEFQCGNGRCIPNEDICNGHNDCGDNTDEADDVCEASLSTCRPDEFTCYDGDCIPKSAVCDGRFDCRDQTDESACGENKTPVKSLSRCGQGQFECNDGICIADYKHCNGIVDCHDESDETSCNSDDCSINEFSCDGQCFELRIFCNGMPDCADGSDERNCITCHGDAFHCQSKQCIPPEHRCDGFAHCSDGSDERGCNTSVSCGRDQWQCRNGLCLNSDFRCDGNHDCADGSDEEDCEAEVPHERCTEEEFLCDGRCMDMDRRCDGRRDCVDNADEEDCLEPPVERCTQLQCPDGTCFEHSQRCDGRRDCADGFDEQGCRSCNQTEFTCLDGHFCIDIALRCDSFYDCKDFSDEQNCFACRSNEFTCGDGHCIPSYQVCNKRADCRDESDERNCSCARNEYRCGTGQCIDESRRCDQRVDCSDGSDERDCRHVECRSHEWRCHSGHCIRLEQRCNRRFECPDRSDEMGCHSCAPNMFRCENGPCIDLSLKCNGRVDCPYDTSDELDCFGHVVPPPFDQPRLDLKTYPNEQSIKESNEVVFQCRDEGPIHAKVKWVRPNGQPLPPGTRDLNGRLEIPNIRIDHSGEYVCEAVGYPKSTLGSSKSVSLNVERYNYQRPPTACAVNEATCSNGDCILKTQICDGNRDCLDGSDETSCSRYQKCEPNQFKCRNNKCVLKTWLCDGEQDCNDGSDEENCATLPPNSPCRYDEYQCRSGQCIPKSFQCDTHADCLDKSDEVGCMAPSVVQPPPPSLTIPVGGILNITCRATGIPVPLIVWRLNWNHVPEKCNSQSDRGFGRLTCEDMQPIDAGAYSCEIINSMGTHFVSPDTIVIVTGAGQVCQQGYFNNKARNPNDCINCFCFGVTSTCKSADLYTYALKPPVSSLTVVGVEGPWSGRRELVVGEFENHNLTAQRHGVQLRLTNLVPGRRIPYYSLPEEYKGNQLKSYGGSIRYDVEYDGHGRPILAPDVILQGNGITLLYSHNQTFYPDVKNHVTVSLLPGLWQKPDQTPATRGDIMMLLASIDSILIRMQYIDAIERNIELVNIMMDSAGYDDRGLGSASLVEECRCPPGYRGLSCESCDYDYVRQSSGPWLGRCVPRAEECRPGYYGDPNRGLPCQPCPCPVAGEKSRARSCYLDARDNVVCKCDRGYAGERCMECDVGYVGNPLGEGCFPRPVSNCNSLGTERALGDGRCYCKPGVEGQYCDRCSAQHFYMHDKGCVECFCMGVSNLCSSTTQTRDVVQASFADGRSSFSLISDYTNPSVVANSLPISNREIVYRNFGVSDETFYWRLPTQFLGNKLTSFGGHLNYTLRYTPHSSGGVSRNNSPDVVLHSGNKIKLHHYRANSGTSPIGSSTNSVPVLEDFWQNYEDGNTVNREYLLMALANVSDIFIKATYTTVSNEAALSHVSLDIAREHPYGGSGARAWPVEQCQCPQGHIGLSCEDCAPGYYKGDNGIYLGLCERCECNGHSEECDPQTGDCLRCRDNTYGGSCEYCLPQFTGNATGGTPYDCKPSTPSEQVDCNRDCDARGGRCTSYGCECKELVEGRRCDQCREGSFGLSSRHGSGCLECFCSGVTKSCGISNMYREELPVIVDEFDNTITLADRDGKVLVRDNFNINPSINVISYVFRDRDTYYWNLPSQVLGSQILSYGANLTVTQQVDGGRPLPDQDIILIGNGLKLVWSRDHYDDGTYIVPLHESYWTVINRRASYPASRSDLLTVLAHLDHILIRATTKEGTRQSSMSDITLGTAVTTRNYNGIAEDVEMCRCPPGYRGTSCELCEDLHYRDIYNRRAGMPSVCKRCPCENADSCQMDNRGEVSCNCREGYTGVNCDNRVPKPMPPRLAPGRRRPVAANVVASAPTKFNCSDGATFEASYRSHYAQYVKCDKYGAVIEVIYKSKNKRSHKDVDSRPILPPPSPVIEVNINVPSIQIVEVGNDFRADCHARHLVSKHPIEVEWKRENGHMPDHAYTDRGTLVITNIQITDGGSYVCRAGSGSEVVYKQVTINVSKQEPVRPAVKLSPQLVDQNEYQRAEVRCVATGYPTPTIVWERVDQPMPFNTVNEYGLLRFNSLRLQDAGTYRCLARNDVGEADALLTVYVRPVGGPVVPPPSSNAGEEHVEIMPSSFDGQPGQQIRLVCQCSPTARVTWNKQGETRLPPNANVRNEILIIEHASQENSGRYSCTAYFPTGRVKVSTVDVLVTDSLPPQPNRIAPRVNPLNKNYVLVQGADFSLPCEATGTPFPTIKWTLSGKPFESNVQQSSNVLRIFNAQPSNGGVYICVANNEEGMDRAYTVIEIDRRERPVLELYPSEPQTIKVGESVRLSCRASAGVPYPTISWVRKDRMPLSTRFTKDAEGVITLHEATLEDAGEYECRAENVAGSAALSTMLEVLQPPMITLEPNEYHKITENDDFTIYCSASGKPAPTLTLTPPHGALRSYSAPVEGLREVSLQLHRAELQDAGTYECTAKNAAGEDSQYLTLQVEPKRGDIGKHSDDDGPNRGPEPIHRPQPLPPTQPGHPLYHTYKAVLGEQATLICNEEHRSARTEWRRSDGRALPYGSIVRGGNLTIENTGHDANGLYDCITYSLSTQPVTLVRIMVEVIAPPKISFSPPMPMTVRPGDKVEVLCNVTGDQPIQFRWHGEDNRSLPRTVHVYGNYLQFYSIAPEDAGRYYCTAWNHHGNTTKVAEVIVNKNEMIPNGPFYGQRYHDVVRGSSIRLDCQLPTGSSYGGVRYTWTRKEGALPSKAQVHGRTLQLYDVNREDAGNYECTMYYSNGTVAYDSVVLSIMAPESLPILQLEPSRSYVRPGESIAVDCTSSAGTTVPIRWEKGDGSPLPFNIRQDGNRLFIANAREDDTGKYTCVCYTEDGLRYISDFELQVEDNTIPDVPRTTARVEYADRGTTVKLQCNTDLHPTSYQWSRNEGSLPADEDTRSAVLVLPDVQASSAGTYVCTAKHGGQTANVLITLVVNGVIPFFPQSPRSYIEFKPIENVYSKFYFEISFKPEKLNGLLLYSAQRRPHEDFIALSLNAGYPQFRFRFGGELVTLQPDQPVRRGEWHTVKVNRVRNNGFLLVDDQAPVNFPERLRFHGLNLDDHLFVGGVPNFDSVPANALESREGFVGCISRLKLNDREVQLYEDAITTVGLTACEPCAEDPCNHGAGTCMESQTVRGYECLCREGHTGRNCEHEGIGCAVDTCGVGRCQETDAGPECYCPVHKTGDRCQYTEHYSDATLAFKDGSYAAYDKFQSKRSVQFRFKPDSLENGVLFYAAEHEQAYGDYLAVILNNGFIELRYSVAGKIKPSVLRSIVPIEVGRWHRVSTGRSRAGVGYLQVDEETVINEMPNRNPPILLKTKVYAGGYDKRLLISQELGVRRGFEGCIAELETSGNKVNMIEDIQDSANVYHCGHEKVVPPARRGDEEDEGSATCRPGRGGVDCEIVTDICLDERPCENGAPCLTHAGGLNYTCTCQPGYLGLRCESVYNTIVASRFRGNGFIEVSPDALEKGPNQLVTEIAILFSAYENNGLLLWYGQRNGEEFLGNDYIALAVQDGFVELTIRMDGQESSIRHLDAFVADGERHVALVRRDRNQFHLQVDSMTVHGETRPTGKQTMNLPGSIYIGGVPDIERVTGNRYNESFDGCVFSVENNEKSRSIELRDFALRTVNVDVCDEQDLGTEPPVV